MNLLCEVCIIHDPFVMFKICRITLTINLCLAMLKNKWTHMGKDLIQVLHTKAEATIKHIIINNCSHTETHLFRYTFNNYKVQI